MPDYERSFAAPRAFTDEYIEHCAVVFLANPQLRRRGVLFETFLLAPAEILAACAAPVMTVSRCGLLPEQRQARMRADTEAALRELGERALAQLAAEAHCANGVWCEKLKHRAWPKHRGPRKYVLREM